MNPSYDVTESSFESLVREHSNQVPVLLDIGADWCSPCRALTPLLEKLAQEYAGRFVLAKVDADENMRIAGSHQAKGFPTVIGYSGGQVRSRFHGMQTEGYLRRFIDQLIAQHTADRGLEESVDSDQSSDFSTQHGAIPNESTRT